MEFANKVVIITGAARGMGKATAEVFAEEGALLTLVDLKKDELDAMAEELGLEKGKHLTVSADVSKEDQVNQYVQHTVDHFGGIDVLFNNAGIPGVDLPLVEISDQQITRCLDINVKGVFFGLKHVIPVMVKQKSGAIINTSSLGGIRVLPLMADYAASKWAVIGLTKAAAVENAGQNIRVNVICPGAINTRMVKPFEKVMKIDDTNRQEMLEKTLPLKRYGEPREIGELVKFLASSEKAGYITGAIFQIDGGLGI